MVEKVELQLGDSSLIFETGKIAKQANGAALVSFEGSAILATACASRSENRSLDYLPLTVNYVEKFYAAGKIPGGFFKREGRPQEKEILVSRLIDRPLRPLFPKDFGREIQIIATTMSTDQINPPDVLAMNGASLAVGLSDIPMKKLVVRFGLVWLEILISLIPHIRRWKRQDWKSWLQVRTRPSSWSRVVQRK